MAKYQSTGAIAHFNRNAASYGDATGADFKQAMDISTSAQQNFDQLPSSLRKKFGNDPAAFLDFVQDPKNADEMAELGLREATPADKDKKTAQGDSVAVSDDGAEPKSEAKKEPKSGEKDS